MGLTEILTQFKQVRDDLSGGKFASALRDVAPIIETLADLATAIGFKAGPDDDAVKAEILACADDCCKLTANPPKAAADPQTVGKIGDGKILAALFEWAKLILPLLL